jgi:hypothetical protein
MNKEEVIIICAVVGLHLLNPLELELFFFLIFEHPVFKM